MRGKRRVTVAVFFVDVSLMRAVLRCYGVTASQKAGLRPAHVHMDGTVEGVCVLVRCLGDTKYSKPHNSQKRVGMEHLQGCAACMFEIMALCARPLADSPTLTSSYGRHPLFAFRRHDDLEAVTRVRLDFFPFRIHARHWGRVEMA